MQIVNLTPHDVNIIRSDGTSVTFSRHGTVARVAVERTKIGDVFPDVGPGIPLYDETYGEVSGLPNPVSDVVFIVSAMVRLAERFRRDIYSPGELVRDAAGQPVGCLGLVANG